MNSLDNRCAVGEYWKVCTHANTAEHDQLMYVYTAILLFQTYGKSLFLTKSYKLFIKLCITQKYISNDVYRTKYTYVYTSLYILLCTYITSSTVILLRSLYFEINQPSGSPSC